LSIKLNFFTLIFSIENYLVAYWLGRRKDSARNYITNGQIVAELGAISQRFLVFFVGGAEKFVYLVIIKLIIFANLPLWYLLIRLLYAHVKFIYIYFDFFFVFVFRLFLYLFNRRLY
jgi:hypothetical protein